MHGRRRPRNAYVVGSEEIEPGAGWPYHTVRAPLAAKPSMTPADVGALVVNKYLAFYGPQSGVTQSALDQRKISAVRQAVERLGGLLLNALGTPITRLAILDARRRVQRYAKTEYVDLVHLCNQIKIGTVSANLRTASDAVVTAVKATVVKSGSKGKAVARSHGVSIYFPTNGVSPLYKTLDFARRSTWAKFIAAYQS